MYNFTKSELSLGYYSIVSCEIIKQHFKLSKLSAQL